MQEIWRIHTMSTLFRVCGPTIIIYMLGYTFYIAVEAFRSLTDSTSP